MLPDIQNPLEQRLPQSIYEEVLRSLDKAEAYIKIELEPGEVAFDRRGRLQIEPGTDAGVWLKVDGGTVTSARVEFTRRVRLEVTPDVTLTFRELRVAANGEVDPIDLDFDYPLPRLLLSQELPKIRQLTAQNLRMSTDLYAIFVEGKVFAPRPGIRERASAPTKFDELRTRETAPLSIQVADASGTIPLLLAACFAKSEPSNGRTVKSLQARSQETEFKSRSLMEKVVRVTARINEATMRQGSVLLLTDYDRRDAVRRTRIVIGPGSTASIPFAEIRPSAGTVKAQIDLALTTLDSAIVTKERRFDFASGSKLIARGLAFEKWRNGWKFVTPPSSGYAELALKAGEFSIEESHLSLAPNGSSILLYSLDLAATNGVPLAFGGAGRITLKVDSGSLHFNQLPGGIKRGYIALGSGSQIVAEGVLHPVVWDQRPAWRIENGSAQLDLNVRAGIINLGSAGSLVCGDGTRLESANVDFDTTRQVNFSGRIDRLQVERIEARTSLQGSEFQSILQIDPESYFLLGDSTHAVITDLRISRSGGVESGRLAIEAKATGGQLRISDNNMITWTLGTSLSAKDLALDGSAKRFISGVIDNLDLIASSARLTDGLRWSVSLSPGSAIGLHNLNLEKTGSISGTMSLNATAFSGSVILGRATDRLTIGEGTSLRATSLLINTTNSRPIFGVVDRMVFRASDGTLSLPGSSALVRVSGGVSVSDLTLQSAGRNFAALGQFNMSFGGGKWDHGGFALKLNTGTFDGSMRWSNTVQSTKCELLAGTLKADLSATGDFGTSAPEIAATMSNLSATGDLWSRNLEMATGEIDLVAKREISAGMALSRGDMDKKNNIPADPISMRIVTNPGWHLNGNITYGPNGLTGKLSQSAANPLVVKVHHESINDGRRRANLFHWADGGCKLEVWWNAQVINVGVRAFEAVAIDGKLRVTASAGVASDEFEIAPDLHGYWYCEFADWMFDIEKKIRNGVRSLIAENVNKRIGNFEFVTDF